MILDGTEDVARVLVVGDASGMSAMPKGSVSTGFGGTASADGSGAPRHGYTAPALELSLIAAMLGLTATRQLNRRRRQRSRPSE